MVKLSDCLRVYAERENKMEWKTWRRCEPNGWFSMRRLLLSPAMGHTSMTADTVIPRNRDSIEQLVPFCINSLIAYASTRFSSELRRIDAQRRLYDCLSLCRSRLRTQKKKLLTKLLENIWKKTRTENKQRTQYETFSYLLVYILIFFFFLLKSPK